MVDAALARLPYAGALFVLVTLALATLANSVGGGGWWSCLKECAIGLGAWGLAAVAVVAAVLTVVLSVNGLIFGDLPPWFA